MEEADKLYKNDREKTFFFWRVKDRIMKWYINNNC